MCELYSHPSSHLFLSSAIATSAGIDLSNRFPFNCGLNDSIHILITEILDFFGQEPYAGLQERVP